MEPQYATRTLFFRPEDNQRVRCDLCPHGCVLPEGQVGRCLVRRNFGGQMVNLVWGRPGAMSVEPVGNLPLYHFLPRADAFCIGTAGCPLDCSFCRTHELARTMPLDMQFMLMPPEKVVFAARENKCRVIAFTFNDPTACAEYMMDVSEAAARADIRTVAVSGSPLRLTLTPGCFYYHHG
ncbi:MAG TPA: radical SAM protein, partial [Myxococcota bacterium]|nr:radical SAM protein [Myxococcota bacterium]